MDDDEEILWEPRGMLAFGRNSREFIKGKFILTNKKMGFEVKKKALMGLVDMGTTNKWKICLDEIDDIEVSRRKALGPKRCFIKTSGKVVILDIDNLKATTLKNKLETMIRDSKKKEKDDDFEKELKLRKASKSEVNVNIGDSKKKSSVNKEIPDECFACGEKLDPDDIEWVGPGKIECPECGAKIKIS